jgi:hypothetical protein
MDTYKIFQHGCAVGQVALQKDGLYWQVEARCGLPAGEPLRLYAGTGGRSVCLGVLIPEDGGLSLRRRLSARSAAFGPDTRFYLDEEDGWRPYPEIPGSQTREGVVQIPYREGEPFAQIESFRAFHLESRAGRLWWTAALEECGAKGSGARD